MESILQYVKSDKHDFNKISFNHFVAHFVKPHDMIAAAGSTLQKHALAICSAIVLGMKNNNTKCDIIQMLNKMSNQDDSSHCK